MISGFHDHFTDSIQDSETEREGTFSHQKLIHFSAFVRRENVQKLYRTVLRKLCGFGGFQ
jgi:hypothetical protein